MNGENSRIKKMVERAEALLRIAEEKRQRIISEIREVDKGLKDLASRKGNTT